MNKIAAAPLFVEWVFRRVIKTLIFTTRIVLLIRETDVLAKKRRVFSDMHNTRVQNTYNRTMYVYNQEYVPR